MPTRERFTITIEDAGDANRVPDAPRLRRLLKAILRAYSFRCRDIRPAETVAEPTNKKTPERSGVFCLSGFEKGIATEDTEVTEIGKHW